LDVAVGGVAPLTALTFREEASAHRWLTGFEREVAADARDRGFSRRRLTPPQVLALNAAAAVVGVVVILAAVAINQAHTGAPVTADTVGSMLAVGILPYVLFAGLIARVRAGVRDTPEGRAVAARWLGLREYLRGDEAFAALPPAAVAVWDRYLAYGDALGVNRICAAVIDLRLGNRRLVWSAAGGTWHQVRVRYPAARGRYGAGAVRLLVTGAVWIAIGAAALRWRDALAEWRPQALPWLSPLPYLGLAVLALGVYRVVRTVVDLSSPVRLTGEVLWLAPWRYRGRDDERAPFVHYIAVEAGGGDRKKAWGLPSAW